MHRQNSVHTFEGAAEAAFAATMEDNRDHRAPSGTYRGGSLDEELGDVDGLR